MAAIQTPNGGRRLSDLGSMICAGRMIRGNTQSRGRGVVVPVDGMNRSDEFATPGRSSAPTVPAASAPRILICDDEAALRALIRAALGSGYSIAEAEDGDRALELTRRFRPDLILLDVMMPGRSGLEVLAELRADPALAAIPVIVMTARAQASDREAVAQVPAARYLRKPFRVAELVAAVEELLGRG